MATAAYAQRRIPAQPSSHAARLATLLDSQFVIPGTNIRFGIDGLLGLIPGIGDTIAMVLSLIIVAEAVSRRVRKRVIALMLGTIALDWLIGLVPLVGDVFDVAYKANLRNLRLLEEELRRAESHMRRV
ncbi:MAG: DUF4112 domain-containing protein [Phycisphaerales bacterium]|nr:DUF4112 domain-containing protein [Phycisphaerales bacterium]